MCLPACKSKQTTNAQLRGGAHRIRALKVRDELAHLTFVRAHFERIAPLQPCVAPRAPAS